MLQCVVSVYATYLFLNYPTEQNWKTSIQCLVENFRRHLLKSQNQRFRDFSKRLFNFSYWNLSDSLAGSKMSKNKHHFGHPFNFLWFKIKLFMTSFCGPLQQKSKRNLVHSSSIVISFIENQVWVIRLWKNTWWRFGWGSESDSTLWF